LIAELRFCGGTGFRERIQLPEVHFSENEAPQPFSIPADFDGLMLKLLPLATQ
jgi:hypothetical protein